ncbi:hypothetical protein HPB51_001140 [Rhipicephalus microplus]|uniref:THAP-type domain-containing protein n=1 Tax=Rhipicephalus microplus TaxID=6941 RepID=A0A9J6EW05_RHIMP|nr:hypothetical protein HPB51_001140 [Rhipicephalus microplus]
MTAYGRKNSKGMRTATTTRERTPTRGGQKGGGRTAAPRNAYQRIVAISRLPQLPRDAYRIIVRPKDGLNVTKVSQIRFEQALAMAAALAPAEIEEDTICTNGTQNIYVVCTPHEKNACARGRSVTPAAQRRKSRSRSRGRSASRRRIQEQLTWADRVKEKTTKPKKVTRSASPEHDAKSDIEQLRQEIASLKAELRKQTAAQAISSRVEGANVADNAVHKSAQEPKVEVNKAKRKAPPPQDESDSEMQVESSQNKMLEELLRISKENQLSINQLALRMGELESKPADITKTYKHIINGEVVEVERGAWALKSGVVPTQFPNLPSYLSFAPKRRRSPKKRASACRRAETVSCHPPSEEPNELPSDCKSTDLAYIIDNSASLWLPWNRQLSIVEDEPEKSRQAVFYETGMSAGVFSIMKSVVIREDLTYVISANGKLLQESLVDVRVRSQKDVEAIVQAVHSMKFCLGCTRSEVSGSGKSAEGSEAVHHKDCTVLTNADKEMCAMCVGVAKILKKKALSKQPRKKVAVAASILRKRLIRATAAGERKKAEVQRLSIKLKNAFVNTVDDIAKDLPEPQKMALRAAIMQQAAKSPRGHRYTTEWLMVCLLLRLTSPKCYRTLSDMKVLPLPSIIRLTQLLRGLPCEYGMNKFALESIKLHMNGKPEHHTYGSIIIDEIKLREITEFNRTSYSFDGFVNYGDVSSTNSDELADHALVVMFNPIFEPWIQPVAAYATKGAAPGSILAKIVISTVLQLHQYGAKVLTVISDGARSKKFMWTHLGVNGKPEDPKCKIKHPCLPDASLHFICDVPHIMQCIRNHLMKHKYAQIGNNQVSYEHYVRLYKAEKKANIQVVPKLTEYHVKPQALQKMNVCLATQLFSQSVAIGLKVYRQLKVPGFSDSAGTEAFTKLLNHVFDILNAKVPAAGIRRDSPKIKRFFGLVRSFGGDEDHPTVTNFGQLFRLLSLYTPVKLAVKGNCEGGNDQVLLSALDSLGEKRPDSLSREEALELFFSLPDESDTSEDEAESSDDEFAPELAPRDSSGDEDEPGPSTGKRKRRRQRTSINRKRASQDSMEPDVKADATEEEIGEEWGESEPSILVGSPKLWDPEFTKEAVPRAVDFFALYFDEEVIEMILEQTNHAGAQRSTTKWAVLTADELRAYFGLLLLMSVSPRHHFYHYWSRNLLFYSEEIAKVMSFKRFQYIMNSLRVNDHSKEKKKGEDENVKPGTQLFFDNYFMCTRLMKTLAERGVHAAGTVRTNRKDLTEELKRSNKLKKGEYLWCAKGQVTAYQWHDTKDVHLLSNFHDPKETVEVPRKLTNGSSVAVVCPKAVADYNLWMGAVDRFDQKRNSYTADRRSKKSWYHIFYFHFDASVVNAFIPHSANTDVSYLWFRLVLGRQLTNGPLSVASARFAGSADSDVCARFSRRDKGEYFADFDQGFSRIRRKCFVPNCSSGYASCKEKVITFKVPSDPVRLEAWARAIPRKDRQLTPRDYVCEKHFSDSDIDRRRYYGELGGEVLLDKPKRPVLLRDAVPSIFPRCPSYLSAVPKKGQRTGPDLKCGKACKDRYFGGSRYEQTRCS